MTSLTPRQREALGLAVRHHLSTGEVALRMGIAYQTADNHIGAAIARTGGVNRYHAAELAGIRPGSRGARGDRARLLSAALLGLAAGLALGRAL